MKTLQKFLLISFGIVLFSSSTVFGQFTISRVIDQNVNTSQDGFYYALPRTVLEINIVYDNLKQIKGPLADYAQNYLGTDDYIRANSTNNRILKVEIQKRVEADPDQVYYVQFPAEKSKDEAEMVFQLSSIGTLLAFDNADLKKEEAVAHQVDQTFFMIEEQEDFRYQADYHRKKKVDTIIRRITIDTISIDRFLYKTSWVDKSTEDKAEEAAQQISKIREGRFNLLTGYQEVNYGASMEYMDRQLKNLENQYLELFLGKEIKTIESRTFYYTPSKSEGNHVLFELPDGNSVTIKLQNQGVTSKLPDLPLAKTNNVYYRHPDHASVEISNNGKVYYLENFVINQFGVIVAAPLNRTRSQFDPETGSLIKLIRE